MSLVLEIEFLTGVCRAAQGPGIEAPDWPPQPDRVFSALVSAWGARGESREERAALEWLEEQPTPQIFCAIEYSARTAPDVFVPPNDLKASKAAQAYLKVLPDKRPRHPRRFPATRLDDPNLQLIWPDLPNRKVFDALNALASCIGYIGHSASFVRCRFVAGHIENPRLKASQARRRVYPGRLRELEQAHCAKPERPVISPGAPVFLKRTAISEFQTEWLVLEAINGEIPDIRASALVCRLLRQALMSGYRRDGLGDAIPEVISGHAPDGSPSQHPHVAVSPMAFVGSQHADGRVFGFALIPPPGQSLLLIDGFRAAFESVAAYRPEKQRRVLALRGSPLRTPLELAPAPDNVDAKWSLLPHPYLKESRRWASVTPIVLERHLKKGDDVEIRELVARACKNAGLPCPQANRIRVGKHSSVEGAPPARPLTGEPPWTRWKLPKSLKSRQLVHAVIDFDQPVSGPVLLGAGRYTGLGLCCGLRSS